MIKDRQAADRAMQDAILDLRDAYIYETNGDVKRSMDRLRLRVTAILKATLEMRASILEDGN